MKFTVTLPNNTDIKVEATPDEILEVVNVLKYFVPVSLLSMVLPRDGEKAAEEGEEQCAEAPGILTFPTSTVD